MAVSGYLSGLYRSALDVIYPPLCLVCEADLDGAEMVCRACSGKVKKIESSVCLRCGAPGAGIGDSCVCRNLAAGLESLRSSILYKGIGRDIIHLFKFGGYWGLAPLIADMMIEDAGRIVESMKDTVVVGVPLHRVRLRERGYDQAKLIARALSERLGIEYDEKVLKRIRNTKPQARLSLEDRKGNVRDAFQIDDPSKIDGRTVLLIDDVTTTGTTLSSCASVLAGAGARNVLALTFARRILDDEYRLRRRADEGASA